MPDKRFDWMYRYNSVSSDIAKMLEDKLKGFLMPKDKTARLSMKLKYNVSINHYDPKWEKSSSFE